MKISKKITSLIMIFTMMFTIMASTVNAFDLPGSGWDTGNTGQVGYLEPEIDETKKGSIKIEKLSKEDSKPLAGAGFTIYKVGTIEQTTTGQIGINYKSLVDGVILTSNTKASEFEGKTLTAVGNEMITDAAGIVTFDNLEVGIYLVRETKTPTGVTVGNDFLVSMPMSTDKGWNYDVVAKPKNSKNDGSIHKKGAGGTADPEGNQTVSIGEKVSYDISANLPSDIRTSNYTKLNIVDTPDASLKIDLNTVKVSANSGTTQSVELVKDVDYVLKANGANGFIVELVVNGKISDKIITGSVDVSYEAVVLSTANPGDLLKNDVQLDYKTDKGEGTIDPPDTIEPPVYVTYSFGVKKVDDKNAPLSGAEFALKDKNGNFLKYNDTDGWAVTDKEEEAYKLTTGADGLIKFKGLKYGEYTLIETKAPTGYSLLKDGIKITIDKDTTAETFSIEVVNKESGITLPETGGKGIMMLIVGGLTLVGISVILLKKSKKETDK